MYVTITSVARDEGTVVVFNAEHNDSAIKVAIDHRPAQGIVDALEEHGEVEVEVESWQVLR